MPKRSDVSPNTPDVEPDYVDLGDGSKPNAAPKPAPVSEPDSAPPEPSPAVSPNDRPPDEHEPTKREVEETVLDATGIMPVPPAGTSPSPPPEPRPDGETPDSHDQGAPTGFRDHECIPNIPDAAPEIVTNPVVAAPANGKSARPDAAEAALPTRRSWPRWDLVLTVLVISLFGLLVFGQAVSALALSQTLPVWAQYLLLIPLGFCCLAVLFVCANVLVGWFRLRRVRQIDMEALAELRLRAQTRNDGVREFQAARAELEGYLKRHPLDPDSARRLRDAGVSAETCEKLAEGRDYLLGKTSDSLTWLEEFREHFQSHLDRAARERVRHWSLVAAGCVVASPVPLLDAALILGVAAKMVRDLCGVYNVRGGRSTGLVLLNRAVITAFIAGVAEDAAVVATDAASDELAGIFGETALGAFSAGVARTVAPKLGEGAINAFFINRLGKATIRLLQPLKPN